MDNFIGYARVSTKEQGHSWLGISHQLEALEKYTAKVWGQLLSVYTEVESGKNDSRPELQRAIDQCKEKDTILLIAKLDRLSRNLTFISSLMDSRVKFKAVDMPEADNFTIHIFAALAQKEREMISERTKNALAQKKKQGIKLWKPENLTAAAQQKACAVNRLNAQTNTRNLQAGQLILFYRRDNLSYRKIACELKTAGFKTREGKDFAPMTVKRLYDRFANNTPIST